jgi:hypothetical protein
LISGLTAKREFTRFVIGWHKCCTSYSAYFGKKVTCCVEESPFQHTGKLLLLHSCNTQDRGLNQIKILREENATYYHTTIYHGHLITPTFYLSDNLSRRSVQGHLAAHGSHFAFPDIRNATHSSSLFRLERKEFCTPFVFCNEGEVRRGVTWQRVAGLLIWDLPSVSSGDQRYR